MADDFYPFVDSGDRAPDNSHITGEADTTERADEPLGTEAPRAAFATRIAIYDDMLSTPRVVVIEPNEVRPYLEEVTNTVYRCMKEQGGNVSLMVIREIVENFIHAHFVEPIISILDGGNTIRFADQGPGIADKERAFEFGVTSADRDMKRYIRGTGAGFPMVQQYLEAAGGAVSIEDNLGAGTVVTVSLDPARVSEIRATASRGAAVRGGTAQGQATQQQGVPQATPSPQQMTPMPSEAVPYTPDGAAPSATPAAAPWAGPEGAPYAPAPSPETGGAQNPQAAGNVGNGAYPQTTPGTPGYMPPAGYPAPQGAWGQQGYWPGWNPAYPTQSYAPPAWQAQPGAAGYPFGYQQPYHQFSTIQQPAGQPYGSTLQGTEAAGAANGPYVSERGRLALAFLLEHGQAGPTDLATAFGHSGPTWSRELATLNECGFVVKHGQKYHLTELGSSWTRSQ